MKVQIGKDKNSTEEINNRGCRTQQQYDAFKRLMADHRIMFLCNNPFNQEFPGQQFKCTFSLTCYDFNDQIHGYIITPTGIIRDAQAKIRSILPVPKTKN